MTVSELFPTLKNLARADKLRIIQFLEAELANEAEPSLESGATYRIWSPFNSHKAAHQLGQLLESESQNPNA